MACTKSFVLIIGAGLLVLLQVLATLMAVGGLGRIAHLCKDPTKYLACEHCYGSHWWSIVFQVIVFVMVCLSALVPRLGKFRMPMLIFLAMTSGRLMQDVEKAKHALDIKVPEDLKQLPQGGVSVVEAEKAFEEATKSLENDNVGSNANTRLKWVKRVYVDTATGRYDIFQLDKNAQHAYLGGLVLMIAINFLSLLLIGSEERPGVPAVRDWLWDGHNEAESQEMSHVGADDAEYGDVPHFVPLKVHGGPPLRISTDH